MNLNINDCNVLADTTKLKTIETLYHIGDFNIGVKLYIDNQLTILKEAGTYGLGLSIIVIGSSGNLLSVNNCGATTTTTTTDNGITTTTTTLIGTTSTTTSSTTNSITTTTTTTVAPNTFPIDVIMNYWLGYTKDYMDCEPDSGFFGNCNPNNYNPAINEGAKSRIVITRHRNETRPPHYAVNHIPRSINYWSGGTEHTENADVNFNYNQAAFDKDLEYIVRSGVNAVNLYYYDYDSPNSEHVRYYHSSISPYKNAIKFLYSFGGFGFNVNTTINRILLELQLPNYYKYNNKPAIVIESGNHFHVDRYILASGATYVDDGIEQYYSQNAGYTGPILFEPTAGYVRSSGQTHKFLIINYLRTKFVNLTGSDLHITVQSLGHYYENSFTNELALNNYQAMGSYLVVPTDASTNHSYSNMIAFNLTSLNNILSNGANNNQKISPCIAFGLANLSAEGVGVNRCNQATNNEIIQHFNSLKALILSNINRFTWVNIYGFGEIGEQGDRAPCPRKNPDGSIDTETIDTINNAIT